MNKTTIISTVIVIVLVVGGWYFYTTMNTEPAVDVKAEMQSVIKSDATKDQSTQPEDISASVDNVDMDALNAQISADMGSF
jgi:predicted negative regulator of RcsB-dependent stress response